MRRNTAQLNIRSSFAKAQVHMIAQRTGQTATQIVEDALRSYVPAGGPDRVGSLVRCGPLLVQPAADDRRVSLDEATAALEATRDRLP